MLLKPGPRSTAAVPHALWNKLPADIRNVASLNRFKKSIKPFLFNKSPSTSFHFIANLTLYLILDEIVP